MSSKSLMLMYTGRARTWRNFAAVLGVQRSVTYCRSSVLPTVFNTSKA
jgi:hypothetical protein